MIADKDRFSLGKKKNPQNFEIASNDSDADGGGLSEIQEKFVSFNAFKRLKKIDKFSDIYQIKKLLG